VLCIAYANRGAGERVISTSTFNNYGLVSEKEFEIEEISLKEIDITPR